MANSNKNVNIKLTRQQQKQIEDAAYTSAKMFMGLSNKSKAAVLIAIGIVLAVIAAWYLFIAPKAQAPDSPATVAAVSASQSYDYTEWSEQIAPNYYRIDGAAIMTHQLKPGDIEYGGLDQYGRAIYAVGYITGEMYKKELDEPREKNLPKPAGYKNLYVGSSPSYNTTIIGPGIYYWNAPLIGCNYC